MKAILHFLKDGTIEGIYTEAINLGCLGRLQVERLSAIEFDSDAQLWRIWSPDQQCLHASPSREECLNWEWDYFSEKGPPK